MNWKKLCKVVLVLALVVATLSGSLLVARAEVKEGDELDVRNDEDYKDWVTGDWGDPPGNGPTDSLVDDSVAGTDGCGAHTHKWSFIEIIWVKNENGEYDAYGTYYRTCCPEATWLDKYMAVKALVFKIEGGYRATILKPMAPDHEMREDTLLVCDHEWVFDRFEWNTTSGVRASAVYHCAGDGCEEQMRIEATVTRLTFTVAPTYVATVTAEQSPDGVAHSAKKIVLPQPGPMPDPIPVPNPVDPIAQHIEKRETNLDITIQFPILVPVNP